MNVVVTSPVWSLNGVNVFAANLIRGLRRSGVPARLVLTGVTHPDSKPLPAPDDFPVEPLPLPTFASWPARWRALIAYLERQAPCLYLPNHDFRHSCISPALSPRVGIVGIAHSDDAQHYEHVARLGRYWNAVVAVSETIAARLRRDGAAPASRLSVIPYGVPVGDGVREAAPDEVPLRIIYTGRLEQRQKRVLDLPEIACALRGRGVDFELTIAGDGPERAALERRVAALGLADRVRLVGTVSTDEVLALCARHDVLLLPSAFEGLPLSLLEAMGQGCVPVVSDVTSGVPELIRDGVNGYRIPVGSIAAFAECLESLARSAALRHRLAERARRTISEGYRIEDMTGRYLRLFDSLWPEVRDGRFARPAGRIAPPRLTWRDHLAAPLRPLRRRWRGGA